MSYQVRFTDQVNNPDPLIVEDNTVNESTSVSFPGRNITGYGTIVAENFLHLLENFANNTAPLTPVEGQLWYDNTSGVNQLKIYDGTNWTAAGGLKKGTTEPDLALSLPGDLWVNTDTQQLYLFTGSGWILIGPKFSSGSRTGAEPEFIIDTLNNSQPVVSQYVAGERVAIISKTTFTPKSIITGFPSVKEGVTLNSNYSTYFGVAEKASALLVGTTTVPAANFLRSDVTSNTNYAINVRNSAGLSVGEDTQLNLGIDGQAGVIFHKTSGSNLDIRMNNNGSIKTVIRVDSSERVGINNTNPQTDLDVTGDIQLSGYIKTTSTTPSISTTTGSGIFAGGVGIAGDINVGGGITLDGVLTINNSILPDVNNGATIGSDLVKFEKMYASGFYGNFYGSVYGNLVGNASGSASKLTSATTFRLDGDITSDDLEFDGATGGTSKVFQTSLSETFISDKTEVTSIAQGDEFIVSRGSEGLKKISKANLWQAISKTPIGAVMPYAGPFSPTGWLLCDGSEVLIADYPELYDVIGFSYGDQATLQGYGTFKLPDLRGRFALGFDNMMNVDANGNQITVPNKADISQQIQPGGGAINRVTDPRADFDSNNPYAARVGAGDEEVTLATNQIPDHEHDMIGDAGGEYAAFRSVPGDPADGDAVSGLGGTTPARGQYLKTSGGILTTPPGTFEQSAINIMNPFLAMNFIIFTGQDV